MILHRTFPKTLRRALGFVLVSYALAACGGGPAGPDPVTPQPEPSGPVSGGYLLKIEPSSTCPPMLGMPARFELAVLPASQDRSEVRLILADGDLNLGVNLMLEDAGTSARGALGTTQFAVPAKDGFYVYFRTIGWGTVTRAPDGRGQILDGTMFGEIAVGLDAFDIGSQAYCNADDHRWTLTTR